MGTVNRKTTSLVRLRDVIKTDLPIFFEQQNDPEANRMTGFPPRKRSDFLAHWNRLLEKDDIAKQTILYDKDIAGNIVSFEAGGMRQIGYWLGKTFWGKGIATDALQLFLKQTNIRPLYASVISYNSGSIRVLEKCGFRHYKTEILPSSPDKDREEELTFVLEA